MAGLHKIRYRATGGGRSKVGPRSKVRTLSGQILPHFDINNFSVAQKLTKLDSLVLVQIKLALIIDIYGINRIIYSTNLLPYSLEYESRKTIPTEYMRKVTRYPVLSQAPWRHLNTSVRTVSLDTFHKARTLGWVGLWCSE